MLRNVVLTKIFCKLHLTTNNCISDEFPFRNFPLYIRRAGRLSHRDQYLSLSTAFRHFYFHSFLTSKDNDA